PSPEARTVSRDPLAREAQELRRLALSALRVLRRRPDLAAVGGDTRDRVAGLDRGVRLERVAILRHNTGCRRRERGRRVANAARDAAGPGRLLVEAAEELRRRQPGVGPLVPLHAQRVLPLQRGVRVPRAPRVPAPGLADA